MNNNTARITAALNPSKTPRRAAAVLPALNERPTQRRATVTYQTVTIDPGALDWAAMDRAAVRTVLNVAGAKAAGLTAAGRLNRDALTVPLSHPALVGILDDYEIIDAARSTERGEFTRTQRVTVPHWYNPNDTTPERMQREAAERALYANSSDYDVDYAVTVTKTNTAKPAAVTTPTPTATPAPYLPKTRWNPRRAPRTVNRPLTEPGRPTAPALEAIMTT